jgi:restriction system protein
MTIPRYDEIQYPLLKHLASGVVVKKADLEPVMAAHFALSDNERSQEYESQKGPVFYDRMAWALSYLCLSGLLTRPKRAHYQITDQGRRCANDPAGMRAEVDRRIAERELARREARHAEAQTAPDAAPTGVDVASSEATPQEVLYSAAESIRASIYDDILATVLGKTARAFEQMVAQLLQRMGYGGGLVGAAHVTPYTNDGGIDGVIREDILGLGRIHIQAKRYALGRTVQRDEIQNFVGALAVAQTKKGVFITTSSFSRGAQEYAASLNGTTNLVLINGQQLARYIYDFGLGMQDEQTIVIRKLDGDFWDQFPDDPAAIDERGG